MASPSKTSYAKWLDAISSISTSITSDLYLDDILRLIITVTAEVMNSKICFLMLLDEKIGNLVMAIKWSSRAKIDLLTIDGSSGGTGMSPWRMMEECGMPSLYLHAASYEFAKKLADMEERVPDLAFAGGFFSEDVVFKALALGAPFTKAVCMCRALMIPGMVGKNIAGWIEGKDLLKTVSDYGTTSEEIFVYYEEVKDLLGKNEMKNIPLGALGIYSYSQKIKVGLQQLMAGARCFNLSSITRNELISLIEECAKVTGIPYLMDAYRKEAEEILMEGGCDYYLEPFIPKQNWFSSKIDLKAMS